MGRALGSLRRLCDLCGWAFLTQRAQRIATGRRAIVGMAVRTQAQSTFPDNLVEAIQETASYCRRSSTHRESRKPLEPIRSFGMSHSQLRRDTALALSARTAPANPPCCEF